VTRPRAPIGGLRGAITRLLAPLLDAPPFYFGPLPGWPTNWYSQTTDPDAPDAPDAPLTPYERAMWRHLAAQAGRAAADPVPDAIADRPGLGDR
jgi:hypothetical protein